MAQAQAQVREAQLNLSYTSVTAPIAGISGRSLKSEGSLVNPGTDEPADHASRRSIRSGCASRSPSPSMSLRARHSVRSRCSCWATTARSIFGNGKLNFAGTSVDTRLGTVRLRAEFPNPELAVLPGQFARAQVIAGEEQALPGAAIGRDADRAGSHGLDHRGRQGRAHAGRDRRLGGQGLGVRKGLKQGDQVIVDNLIKMRPGAPVAQAAPQPGAPGSAPAASAASAPASAR